MHAVRPDLGWYLPASHASHARRPRAAATVPGRHSIGEDARGKQYAPSRQSTHALRPLSGWYLPASHASHTLAPRPSVMALMVPGSHGVCCAAPVRHAEPAGQTAQSA